ncbi:uncharacterized protein [Oscarella lobularis]|uniref:uncharacterized protein isoform X2 n=1 Tax=Oscarella lobularis TaxID=121494 RepID=UPI003313CC3E
MWDRTFERSLQVHKTACNRRTCKTCCRRNPESVCFAHRMGSLAAQKIVDDALVLGFIDVDLSYQQLRSCPPRFIDLGSVPESVNLSNNKLTRLPADLGKLDGSRELFLQYNSLTSLPTSIGDMTLLSELDVKENELTSLPGYKVARSYIRLQLVLIETIGNLKRLIVFNATRNSLTAIPRTISNWVYLEELCLHDNKLVTLPEQLCSLINLESLYLGKNPLESLPSKIGRLTKLTELDVSEGRLTVLPDSITRCTAIIKMWLCHNRLIELPAQIGSLSKLRELHVKQNQLKLFPASLLRIKLYTFTVYQNPVLDESNVTELAQLVARPKHSFPPLVELAARAVSKWNIPHGPGTIPRELQRFLSSVKTCSSCGSPFFRYYLSDVFFHTVGVFHRVPLYEQICSPHANAKCKRTTRID